MSGCAKRAEAKTVRDAARLLLTLGSMRTSALLLALLACAPLGRAAAQDQPFPSSGTALDAPESAPQRPTSLAGPLALVIPGAVLTLGGGVSLVVAGFQSWDWIEDGAPAQEAIYIGSVALGVGVALLFAGLYWLTQGSSPDEALARASEGWRF